VFFSSIYYFTNTFAKETMFSYSLHELTACIYYKIAIERGIRGCSPDEEEIAHLTNVSSHCLDDSEEKRTGEFDCNLADDDDLNLALRLHIFFRY
jgi:hypothetical protein